MFIRKRSTTYNKFVSSKKAATKKHFLLDDSARNDIETKLHSPQQ